MLNNEADKSVFRCSVRFFLITSFTFSHYVSLSNFFCLSQQQLLSARLTVHIKPFILLIQLFFCLYPSHFLSTLNIFKAALIQSNPSFSLPAHLVIDSQCFTHKYDWFWHCIAPEKTMQPLTGSKSKLNMNKTFQNFEKYYVIRLRYWGENII